MRYNKTFKTYSEQLQILINRGLIVEDRELAEFYLKMLNYYRFSSYCIPFQDVKDKFNENTCFNNVLKLYDFDCKIRLLLYEVLEKIEIQIRTLFAYYFGENYGPWGYTESLKFSLNFNHYDWFEKINNEISRSREKFIQHYRIKYSKSPYLPIWMVTEVFSFGSLSAMYAGMKPSDHLLFLLYLEAALFHFFSLLQY